MTLAQLRYAITVAGASSMNEAARKLFISQPSHFSSNKGAGRRGWSRTF